MRRGEEEVGKGNVRRKKEMEEEKDWKSRRKVEGVMRTERESEAER